MTDWIGHLIANWPMWIVIPLLIIGAIAYFLLEIYILAPNRRGYEWPEDKKKRLAKEQAKKVKLKLKKG